MPGWWFRMPEAGRPLRVLVAPDKFKGSLTATEAAAAMAEGVLRVYPEALVTRFPIADGGEGTLDAAVNAGYELRSAVVTGPLDQEILAHWAFHREVDGTARAVIETAQASGLAASARTPEGALSAHSYGCGELILRALDAGATEIIIGLGGSAMSDGGSGALLALGLRILDAHGDAVGLGGGHLAGVASVDASGLDPRLGKVRIRLAVDVTNPLLGPDGSAAVFAPQKGADLPSVAALEAGLRNWSKVLRQTTGRDVNVPGAGAAGGFPAAFLAFTGAVLEPGFRRVAELSGLAAQLDVTDLVITGEGSLDAQSFEGKAPIALAEVARVRNLPVLVVAGRIAATPEELERYGITGAAQLLDFARGTSGTPDPEDAMANAALYLRSATAQVLARMLEPDVARGDALGAIRPETEELHPAGL
ncbi:glycerate kinase [Paeniglutamicibacter kerguelensis]|uniref:Glycerate kinase n=1 Tax=Paeniglutamicibacter kerguelensis TaxID=254788 RepID=A0ABS4X7T9_9MICC|nr:glycerate kinase [Paeniglutamicibacter kerguelensis]MBP2384531.1 glycerate kinase [Paeniglutamicibacter kerguelensis]